MSKQLSEQASELWKTLSSPETAETYQNTLSVTWQILKRLGLTAWLALCLILVGVDWITGTALSSGKAVRAWVEDLKNSDSEQLASVTGEQMIAIGKQSLSSAVVNARKQLGLSEQTVTPLLAPASPTTARTSAAPQKTEANPQAKVEVKTVEAPPKAATAVSAPGPVATSNGVEAQKAAPKATEAAAPKATGAAAEPSADA